MDASAAAGDSRKRTASPTGAPEKRQQSMDAGQKALLEALNNSLGTKLDRVADSLGSLVTRVEAVEDNLKGHDNRLADLELSLRNLRTEVEQGSKPVSEVSTTDNPYIPLPTANNKGGKDTLILGGFPMDSPKVYIEDEARRIFAEAKNIKDLYCPGRRSPICKLEFTSSEAMWAHVKKIKGAKFKSKDGAALWWTVEKTADERLVSKKVARALKLLTENLIDKAGKSEDEAKKMVEADYTRGIVWLTTGDKESKRIFEKPKGQDMFKIADGAMGTPGLDLNLAEALAEINLLAL
eukprot:TRINITY_DN43207_c0_g1_i2.p1 TRINITY_DN43207_c0_g1~~TRINITY_DN43207_c0_g1_i2.p1  ORF type:complete len:295 (+),score=89.90 TRINITY_DN43207_c0_g1_i2:30-914(+)